METRNSPIDQKSNVSDKPGLAVFDFDGTITNGDTFLDFARFSIGTPLLLLKIIGGSFYTALRILQTRSFSEGKEVLFGAIFAHVEESYFLEKTRRYSLEQLPRLIKPQALKKIDWHKSQGHTLVILTASVDSWIKPWAEKNNFTYVIATELEIIDGRLTGKFKTKNCVGKEKARRIIQAFPNLRDYSVYGYGNSRQDSYFLDLVDYPFMRSF